MKCQWRNSLLNVKQLRYLRSPFTFLKNTLGISNPEFCTIAASPCILQHVSPLSSFTLWFQYHVMPNFRPSVLLYRCQERANSKAYLLTENNRLKRETVRRLWDTQSLYKSWLRCCSLLEAKSSDVAPSRSSFPTTTRSRLEIARLVPLHSRSLWYQLTLVWHSQMASACLAKCFYEYKRDWLHHHKMYHRWQQQEKLDASKEPEVRHRGTGWRTCRFGGWVDLELGTWDVSSRHQWY